MGRFLGEADRVVLMCEECGERLVLGGPEEVWLSTRTIFECECGKGVSLASRVEEPKRSERYERQKLGPAPRRVYLRTEEAG